MVGYMMHLIDNWI